MSASSSAGVEQRVLKIDLYQKMFDFLDPGRKIISVFLTLIFKQAMKDRSKLFDEVPRKLIEKNIEKAFWVILENPKFYRSLSLRIDFAEIAIKTNPKYFASRLFQFFSEEELIHSTTHFMEMTRISRIVSQSYCSPDSYFLKTRMYLSAYQKRPSLRERGTKIMTRCGKPIDASKENPRDTPVWRYIGKIHTPFGRKSVFKLDWDFDHTTHRALAASRGIENDRSIDEKAQRNDEKVTSYTFPAIIDQHLGRAQENWWGEVLGYKAENGFNGNYITLPEPSVILHMWKEVVADSRCREGIYKELKIHAVPEGTLSTPQFLESLFNYDVIVSMTDEYVHDHTVHLIRTINAIMTSSEETYLQSLSKIRTHLKMGLSAICTARQRGNEEEDLLYLLELCLGMFADTYLSYDTVDGRNNVIVDLERSFARLESALEHASNGRWWPAFGKMGGAIDRYTRKDVQEAWNRIIVSNNPIFLKIFLMSLNLR